MARGERVDFDICMIAPSQPSLHPTPLPAKVFSALGWGALVGLLAGLLFSVLALHGSLTFSTWQQAFPTEGASCRVFWAITGAAVGMLLVGLAGLIGIPNTTVDKIG